MPLTRRRAVLAADGRRALAHRALFTSAAGPARLKWASFLLIGAILCVAPPALADAPLTLDEAFAQSMASHPALTAARASLEAARQRVGVAGVPRLPTASLDVSHSQSSANFIARPGFLPSSTLKTTPDNSLEPFAFWQGLATARWNAYDFGRTGAAVHAAEQGQAAADADVRATRSALWLQVATAFLQAIATESALASLQEAEAQAKRYVDLARIKVDAQVRPKLDLLKAQSDLAQRHVDVLRAEQDVRSARVSLGTAIGNRRTPTGPLRPPTLDVGTLPEADLQGDDTLEQLVTVATAVRPDFKAQELRIAQAVADLQVQERAANPTLYLSTTATVGGTDLDKLGWNYALTGGVNVPFSALWTQNPQLAESRARLHAMQAQLAVALLGLRGDIDQARTALLQARKRTPAVQALLSFSEAARVHAESRYAAGVASLIELTDADVALTQARIQVLQADVDIAIATARLLQSLGRLPRQARD